MNRNLTTFFYTLLLIVLTSCAIVITPSGGTADKIPPKVKGEKPINQSLNFKSNKIEIYFDEYIKINNLSQELIISPPLDEIPKIMAKNKKLIIEFKGNLKDNTTYNLLFGRSIMDIHEDNVLEDYQYVFSTGPTIDSLQVTGNLKDAYTGDIGADTRVMIYDQGCDTCLYKGKPMYYARSDKNGAFSIKNIKEGNYNIFAVKDENNNFRCEKGESVGFYDSSLNLINNKEDISVRLFKEEEKDIKLIDYLKINDNKVAFLLNKISEDINVYLLKDGKEIKQQYVAATEKRDSLICWLPDIQGDTIKFKMAIDSEFTETVVIENKKQKELIKQSKTVGIKFNTDLYTSKKIFFNFSEPIETFKKEKIILYLDSIKTQEILQLIFTDSSHTKAYIQYPFEYEKKYRIIFERSCFKSIFGKNNDSFGIIVNKLPEKELGVIAIDVYIKGNNNSYISELIDDKNNLIQKDVLAQSKNCKYQDLLPGSYRFRYIKDGNKNGQWDTGNLLKKIQPEEVYYYSKKINLKANWEITDLKFNIP